MVPFCQSSWLVFQSSGSQLCHMRSRERLLRKAKRWRLSLSDQTALTNWWGNSPGWFQNHTGWVFFRSPKQNMGQTFFFCLSVLSFLTHLMHRNQGTSFWLSFSLFSSSTISLGSWWRNSPPAVPTVHSLPLIEQWDTSLHYHRKLLFSTLGENAVS